MNSIEIKKVSDELKVSFSSRYRELCQDESFTTIAALKGGLAKLLASEVTELIEKDFTLLKPVKHFTLNDIETNKPITIDLYCSAYLFQTKFDINFIVSEGNLLCFYKSEPNLLKDRLTNTFVRIKNNGQSVYAVS
ncbi:hypothetical protein RGQ13_00575 [Thalassotalea psychrophila]|uniref:Uncharacterized protein n=1 Tax=Thalassotalea psychrophila TaxID=3065647 RepID=A0ABY9TXK6_9GAMM|nr:hypothetical protein RGQ13_00575 [Colwelliaceae bacterium SQ149]